MDDDESDIETTIQFEDDIDERSFEYNENNQESEETSYYGIDDSDYLKYMEPEYELKVINADDLVTSVESMDLADNKDVETHEFEKANLGYFWIPWKVQKSDDFVIENENDETRAIFSVRKKGGDSKRLQVYNVFGAEFF